MNIATRLRTTLILIILIVSVSQAAAQIQYTIMRGVISYMGRTIISEALENYGNPEYENGYDISFTNPELLGYVWEDDPYFLFMAEHFWNTTDMDLEHVCIELYASDLEFQSIESFNGQLIGYHDLKTLKSNHYRSKVEVKIKQVDYRISTLIDQKAEKYLTSFFTGIDSNGNRHILRAGSWTNTFEFPYNRWSNAW